MTMTNPITPDTDAEKAALRSAAERVIDVDRRWEYVRQTNRLLAIDDNSVSDFVASFEDDAVGEYVALANPQTILALLDEIEALKPNAGCKRCGCPDCHTGNCPDD